MPKNVVACLFDKADLDAADRLIASLKVSRPERVLILQNPSVGLSSSVLSGNFQKRLDDLDAAYKAAKDRDDLDGAKQIKQEIEGVKTERDTALSGEVAQIPQAQKDAAYNATAQLFAVLGQTGTSVKQAILGQDFPKSEFGLAIDVLEKRKQWPSEFPHGQYSVEWPLNAKDPVSTGLITRVENMHAGSAEFLESTRSATTGVDAAIAEAQSRTVSAVPPPAKKDPETREEWVTQYERYYMSFVKDAKAFGVQIPAKGQKWKHLIPQVVEARFAQKAA